MLLASESTQQQQQQHTPPHNTVQDNDKDAEGNALLHSSDRGEIVNIPVVNGERSSFADQGDDNNLQTIDVGDERSRAQHEDTPTLRARRTIGT